MSEHYEHIAQEWPRFTRFTGERIVRCRDCAKWATEKRFTGGCCGAKGDADPGGYCAWGERRDT